jgi:Zn-dependent peptidase ImmA (M78 family)
MPVLDVRSPDYARARTMADRVLSENFVNDPPVRVSELADVYGWPIKYVRWPEQYAHVSGYCDFGRTEIVVNAADNLVRQRFTMAHELGHALLHRQAILGDPSRYNVLMRAPLGAVKDPWEQEANMFAAHLLVPRSLLDRFRAAASERELATIFLVSEEFMRFRLRNEYGG